MNCCRSFLLASLFLLCFGTMSVYGQSIKYTEDFEHGLAGWDIGSELPHDYNNPGYPVQARAVLSGKQSSSGKHSVELHIDGSHDDGVIWLARYFYVEPLKRYAVKLSFQFWSAFKTEMSLAQCAVYAGPKYPDAEADFDQSKAAYLKKGWQKYDYEFETTSDELGRIWVASGVSVVWETKITHYLDDFSLTISPIPILNKIRS